MRVRRGIGRLGVPAVVALIAAFAPSPSAAFQVSSNASATPATYAICSWDRRATCLHVVAHTTATVVPGILYRVRTSVTFAAAGADRIYVLAEASCVDGTTGAWLRGASVAHYENLLAADTASTMTPTVVVTAPASGSLACDLIVRGTKTDPANPPERYRVIGGWIELVGGLRGGSLNHRYTATDPTSGVTIGVGKTYDIVLGRDTLDTSWHRIDAYGELYATSLAPSGGSTTFTTQLIVAQYPYVPGDPPAGYSGGFCQRVAGAVRSWSISHSRHHQTLYSTLAAYPRSGCSASLKVVLRIRVTRGYPLAISGNGSSLIVAAVR